MHPSTEEGLWGGLLQNTSVTRSLPDRGMNWYATVRDQPHTFDAKCALQSTWCFRRIRHVPRKPGKEGNPWRYATCDQLGGNWRLCNELYLIWTIRETCCVSECILHRQTDPTLRSHLYLMLCSVCLRLGFTIYCPLNCDDYL